MKNELPALCGLGASPLLGYVDPGAAGFIIVSVLGFLTAVGYTIRMHFAKLKDRVRKALGKSPHGGEGEAEADAEADAGADADD